MLTTVTIESAAGLVVLCVDDEKAGIDMITERLENNRHVRKILTAFDAAEALRVLSGSDEELVARRKAGMPAVDAVFCDINMPGLTGMEMARVLAEFSPPPCLVFVTGVGGDEAVHAFELGAVDYLLKPLNDQQRVDKAIERVVLKLRSAAPTQTATQVGGVAAAESRDDEVIPVELAGTTKLVARNSVRWVEAQGDYARLYTSDGSHLVRIPLAQLEERWGKVGFVRIHRSYLVPLNLITELRMGASGYTVVIGSEEKELPVSRRHTRELKDKLVRSPRSGFGG
ncbi:LytR/AlgR family response regulator transcription factor [Actinocrispum wychmicini]|uniref:LytTR family two component transcriptional regulator n=1 Tax=Actinocrispum wychmicini TaxID=1213861 RepID=A0A4R2KDH3_9PSEU|nr:response regulator transcription factor [Actinocrispum wychmicini]TCO64565.1 LytTR family two component transcriptional regulator [Actinocrispum wychmicini]